MVTQLPPINVDEPTAVGLANPATEDYSISLPVDNAAPPAAPAVAMQRTRQTQQGVNRIMGKSETELYQAFIQGQEDALRRDAASRYNYEQNDKKQKALQDLASRQGGALSQGQVAKVLSSFQDADPSDVIERAYAQDTLSTLNTARGYMQDNFLQKVQSDLPNTVDSTLAEGSELLTKNQYIQSRLQNTEALMSNQSYVGYGADMLKTMFQPYVEYKQRFGAAGLGLGSNLDSQHSDLYRLPMAEFKKVFDARMDYLEKDNPQLAASYGQALLSQSTFASALNNVFTAMTIPDYLAIGKAGAGLVRSADRINQVRKATNDIVEAAAKDPDAKPRTPHEGAGDLGEAAVQTVAEQNAKGNPLETAEHTLMSTWWSDAKKFVSNPGSYLSREAVTRIHDDFARDGSDLFGRIQTMNRVERTPQAISDPNVIRAEKDLIRTNYKGPNNTLLDIEGPIREPTSGTYWYKQKIGNYDGTQFADKETAEGFARQIGISDPLISGTPAEEVYLPKNQVLKREYTDEVSKPREGNIRFYHGHSEEADPKSYGAWVSTQENYARDYRGGPNKVSYIDLTKEQAIKEGLWDEVNNYPRSTGQLSKATSKKIRPLEEAKGGEKWVANENFHVETKDGRARFFVRNPDVVGDQIEVIPTQTPSPDAIPYNVKSGKYGNPLTQQQVATVQQQGLGFHIEVWTPLKENSNLVRDTMIKTTGGDLRQEAISPVMHSGEVRKVANAVLGWVRNSDDTLGIQESAQRKAVTYTQANIHKWAKGLTQDLEDLAAGRYKYDPLTGDKINAVGVYPRAWFGKLKNREVAQQFERALDYARSQLDDQGRPGAFFKSPGELQDFYNRTFQRDPSFLETKAYFNFVKLVEGDRMMAEVAEFRNRARLGTEQVSIHQIDAKTGDKTTSKWFDGIRLNEFPGGEESILILGKNKGDDTIYKLGHIDSKTTERLKERVKTGQAKVFQIYDRDHQPLDNFSELANGKLISYVYTETAETKPIAFNHVERRGGGHFEWDYDHYIKQADVREQFNRGIGDKRPGTENLYVGDKTVMPIKNRRLGEDVVKLWNTAHGKDGLIARGDWNGVRPIAAKLGIKLDEFTSWYHPGRDADGNPTRPLLNHLEPLVVVNRNKKISEMGSELSDRYRVPRGDGTYRETFVDMTKSGPANNFKVAYNQERNSSFDMRTINDIGTQGNPIYAHQPAEMVDPLTTMNRALNRAINNTFMDDYKIYSVEHWLREAEPYLDATKNEVRSSPFFHFNNPKWRAGVDKATIWNLESNRFKSQQFTGLPSKFDTWIHSYTNALADQFYTKYGPEEGRTIGQKARTVFPIWALNKITDPVDFIRSVTFNFKLGLFAVPQFLVQAQTHSLIWALEPRHGTVGTYSMLLHGWGSFTDNSRVLANLDNFATKLNGFGSKWRPGEWLEARKELERSGFEHVAGEYSNLNNQLKTKFIANDADKFLTAGQYPFRLGEKTTRLTAWYTAFREFRDANPTKPITNLERSQILQKADLLTVNMSRASSSVINNGVFSLSTQFLSYQIKLAELFWGKRLGETLTERNLARARIMTGFTALYGLPAAFGVTGAPINDNVRQALSDDLGYIPGENWWSTMVNEGLPAWQLAMITGRVPNVGDRFGSQGFQNIKQAMRGDIPWWQAVGGAAVSTSAKFLTDGLDPFTRWASDFAAGKPTDERFTITAKDLVEPLKQISSVSTGAKWWTAIQTGKWINNSESNVTDVTPLQATLYGLTGMQPQEADDMFNNNQMIKGEEQAKKAALKEFIKDWRRGLQSRQDGSDDQSIAYFRNAMSRAKVVGMSPDEINTAIAIGNKGYENAIDASDWSLWNKGDYNKRDQRLETYRRKLNMKETN